MDGFILAQPLPDWAETIGSEKNPETIFTIKEIEKGFKFFVKI